LLDGLRLSEIIEKNVYLILLWIEKNKQKSTSGMLPPRWNDSVILVATWNGSNSFIEFEI
jgi:hypothetical protein